VAPPRVSIELLIDDSPDTILRAVDAGMHGHASPPLEKGRVARPNVISAGDWLGLARALEPVLDGDRGVS
jgi:hypothetical protein